MSSLPSDEVAADFKDCLNDLQLNNRYEISNLTIIAKENIEHAQALSKALEQHIRTTSPPRKLPALYVLDSIVKNVGSPYTIYLGRNLYSIFMDAYTLVDARTRKSLESMLATWKDPVPGSGDPTPVFAAETTRGIEQALMKAKAVLNRSQPPRPNSTTFRNTPTPPQQNQRYAPPAALQQPGSGGYPPFSSPYQAQNVPQPTAQLAQSLLAALGRPPPQDDTARLNGDIENLISTAKSDFSRNPFDTSIQQRLKALLDLQTIMKTQQLPPQALEAIRTQVASLSAARPPSVQPSYSSQPPAATPVPNYTAPNLAQLLQRPPSAQPQGTSAMPSFAPGALEALLASATNGQKPSTPQLRQAMPDLANLPVPPHQTNGAPPPPQAAQAQSLLDALRGAGLTTSTHTPNLPPPPFVPPPPPTSTASSSTPSAADLLKSLSSNPLLAHLATPLPPPGFPPPPTAPTTIKPRVPLSQSLLKSFRPDLLATLYASLPSQCPTCGLRFPSNPTGKARKAAHLDWHFRTNQRVAESAHRSVHRLWYSDELEWVRLKEVDGSVMTAGEEVAAQREGEEKERLAKKRRFVVAGTGTGGQGAKCPICQEGFVSEWEEEAQEWVWNDCVEVGGRVYHEGCWEEVNKGAGAAEMKGTKRKAEEVSR
ncbi:hypothetical protein CAC42_1384 [Sphaceloma murrayae]|uniref:CID domain-containing protein n=1 Tax=Sphaceloma murrayae TaxID=2082308 RepID=A0A2K1QGA2_9PEZI|nr:hypothetical protein CAC42_1384 [Sphaceloma murrayae]